MATGQFMQPFWRNEFDNGYFMICADLSPTLCNGQYEDPVQSGNLEIFLKFAVAIPETVYVIVYLEFKNTISINSAGKALKDYA